MHRKLNLSNASLALHTNMPESFYYLKKGERIFGPYPLQQINQMLQAGKCSLDDCLSRDRRNWLSLDAIFGRQEAMDLSAVAKVEPPVPPPVQSSVQPPPPPPSSMQTLSEPEFSYPFTDDDFDTLLSKKQDEPTQAVPLSKSQIVGMTFGLAWNAAPRVKMLAGHEGSAHSTALSYSFLAYNLVSVISAWLCKSSLLWAFGNATCCWLIHYILLAMICGISHAATRKDKGVLLSITASLMIISTSHSVLIGLFRAIPKLSIWQNAIALPLVALLWGLSTAKWATYLKHIGKHPEEDHPAWIYTAGVLNCILGVFTLLTPYFSPDKL